MKVLLFLVMLALAVGSLARPGTEEQEGKRLIQFTETGPAQWLTQAEVDVASADHVDFMDITDHQGFVPRNQQTFALPTTIRFRSTVEAAISRLSVTRIEEFITPFTSYRTRYYTTQNGVDSSNWLFSQIQTFITEGGYQNRASVEQYTHSWAQKSVIARIQGSSGGSEVIILGAHQDSINGGAIGNAPGADDDASGSTTILEAFKGLLDSGFVPKTTVEFQWYAAEEVGLRGSQAIGEQYAREGKGVVAMVNFDMTGYLNGLY